MHFGKRDPDPSSRGPCIRKAATYPKWVSTTRHAGFLLHANLARSFAAPHQPFKQPTDRLVQQHRWMMMMVVKGLERRVLNPDRETSSQTARSWHQKLWTSKRKKAHASLGIDNVTDLPQCAPEPGASSLLSTSTPRIHNVCSPSPRPNPGRLLFSLYRGAGQGRAEESPQPSRRATRVRFVYCNP